MGSPRDELPRPVPEPTFKRVGRPLKRKPGRPPLPDDGRVGFKTRTYPAVIAHLRVLGGGWANRGLELLVKRDLAEAGTSKSE